MAYEMHGTGVDSGQETCQARGIGCQINANGVVRKQA